LIFDDPFSYYRSATEHDPSWYKGWHAYAYMNFEAVLFHRNNLQGQPGLESLERIGLVSILAMEKQSKIVSIIHMFLLVIGILIDSSIHLSVHSPCRTRIRSIHSFKSYLWCQFAGHAEIIDAMV